jgi:hypothetical protein
MIRSVIAPPEGSKSESSNADRDFENYNLMKTWEANMFFGQGFGHAFTEFIPSYDFAQSNFGHTAHNSMLWLMWIGGQFGFTGVLLHVAVALFFFARTLRRTTRSSERSALLVASGILLSYLNQAFGDMGTQSMLINFFVATAVCIIGRLAAQNGAWKLGQAVSLDPVPARAPGQ